MSREFFDLAAAALKRRWPAAVLVVGGNHATNSVALLLANPHVDWVARGEGELAFARFVDQVGAGQPIAVKGFYDRAKTAAGGGACLEQCENVDHLDELPHPDWELIDMATYVMASVARKRSFGSAAEARMGSVMTSRGCPFQCTFCSSHTVHGRKMRYRSVGNVLEELRLLHDRYGVTLIVPEDDLFTVNKPRIMEVLGAIRDEGIPGLEMQFPNALSVNTLDEEVIDALHAAGMRIATLAIESGSEYVQNHIIKKRCSLKRAKRLVRYIRDNGLLCRCYFILGFPGETRAQMQESIDFARDLQADWCAFMIAMPLLGSEMFDQFGAMGVMEGGANAWEGTYAERRFDTAEIGAADLKQLAYRANLDINFLNNSLLREGRYDRAIESFRDVLRIHPFHIFAHYGIMRALLAAGETAKAAAERNRILELIRTNANSAAMLADYGDLMPDIAAAAGRDEPEAKVTAAARRDEPAAEFATAAAGE
jgi:radical SAM superfamily enzyme YgiQ (UPF0313 family)